MNAQTTRLIDRFDLSTEVDGFVASRAAELHGAAQSFAFSGHKNPCKCRTPHAPHVVGQYDTVRHGGQSYYCLGVGGEGMEIVVEDSLRGSPEMPSSVSGYWIAK